MPQSLAAKAYLSPIGFIRAVLEYAHQEEKSPVDLFHLRQSFGFYVMLVVIFLIYLVFGSNLFYSDFTSLIVSIPLGILWFLGFKAAMQGKEKPMPVVGNLFQKWFAFVGR